MVAVASLAILALQVLCVFLYFQNGTRRTSRPRPVVTNRTVALRLAKRVVPVISGAVTTAATKAQALSVSDSEPIEANQVGRRFRERKEWVEKACQRFQSDPQLQRQFPPNPLIRHRIIVDDKHKLIYCEVQKAGCTSWKSLILVLTGKAPSLESIGKWGVHIPGKYTKLGKSVETEEKLRTYTKVMVHREPLDRLMSAYTSKFIVGDRGILRNEGRKILRQRGGLSEQQINTGKGVRFDEFASYVASRAVRSQNVHWRPASSLCEPCVIHYDFYASTGTLDEDTNYILDAIGAPKDLRVPHKNQAFSLRPTFSESFKSLSVEVLGKLLDLYKLDYLLFNYSTPTVSMLKAGEPNN